MGGVGRLVILLIGGATFIGAPVAAVIAGGGVGILMMLLVFGLPVAWYGILLVCWKTKVSFNQPLGYIAVTWGHISPFLWFLRTKRISREEARTARFSASELPRGQGGSTTKYQVKVSMKSGKELVLHRAYWNGDEAKELTRTILDFGRQ